MRGEFVTRDEWYGDFYRCDSCGGTSLFESFNYCPDCGTRVDQESNAGDSEFILPLIGSERT